MKKLWLAAGAVGVLTLAALLVAPTVIDWDAYRGSIAAELSRATGRSVSLDGPIEATFLPSPRILANNVRLGAPKAGKADRSADLLRLRAIEVQVGLLPLLTGHVVVERLTLVRPEVLVETDEAGHFHWLMDGTGGDLPPDVALQRFAINDGTLVWRDRQHGIQARLENVSLTMSADSLSGPAKAAGAAEIGGVPVRFTVNAGRLSASSPLPLNVSLEATGLRAKSEFIGQYLPSERRLTGRFKASGADARAVLATVMGAGAGDGIAAALIAHPFGVEGRVSAGAQGLEANDVILDLADERATGAIRARLPQTASDRTTVDANFSVPRLDLDALATVPPLSDASPSGAADLPRNIRIDLSVNADAVLAAGRAMQGFALKTALADGEIAIERLEGQLPGAGTFSVTGAVSDGSPDSRASDGDVPREGLRFQGKIQAAAANLRDLLSWLQVDAHAVPSGRLARAQLAAEISADDRRLELSNVDLHIDSTRAHGNLQLDYREHATLNLDLAADRLDLDAYLDDNGTAAAATLAALAPSPTPSALSGLAGKARFGVAHLTYHGMDLRNVDLDAKIANGEFAIDTFSGAPPQPEEAFAPAPAEPPSVDAAVPEPVAAVVPPAPGSVSAPASERDASDAQTSKAPSAQPDPDQPAPVQPAEDRDAFVRGILGATDR